MKSSDQKFKPRIGEQYFFIATTGWQDDFGVMVGRWIDGVMNRKHLSLGNCFKTSKMASRCLRHVGELIKNSPK
jgi:hypothetical protein